MSLPHNDNRMNYKIKYQKRFENITDVMKQDIETVIHKNVEWSKMSSFWKKYLKHPDAEALIKIDLEKNDNETYNGTIRLTIPWGPNLDYSRQEYKNIIDLVNNGFEKFTESLAA